MKKILTAESNQQNNNLLLNSYILNILLLTSCNLIFACSENKDYEINQNNNEAHDQKFSNMQGEMDKLSIEEGEHIIKRISDKSELVALEVNEDLAKINQRLYDEIMKLYPEYEIDKVKFLEYGEYNNIFVLKIKWVRYGLDTYWLFNKSNKLIYARQLVVM